MYVAKGQHVLGNSCISGMSDSTASKNIHIWISQANADVIPN